MSAEEKIKQAYQRIDKGSSPSQKQRHALYELWQGLRDRGVDIFALEDGIDINNFESLYQSYMQWNLDVLKEKVCFILEKTDEEIIAELGGKLFSV